MSRKKISSLKSALQTFLSSFFLYLSMVSKVQNYQVYADSLEPRGDKLIVFREKS